MVHPRRDAAFIPEDRNINRGRAPPARPARDEGDHLSPNTAHFIDQHTGTPLRSPSLPPSKPSTLSENAEALARLEGKEFPTEADERPWLRSPVYERPEDTPWYNTPGWIDMRHEQERRRLSREAKYAQQMAGRAPIIPSPEDTPVPSRQPSHRHEHRHEHERGHRRVRSNSAPGSPTGVLAPFAANQPPLSAVGHPPEQKSLSRFSNSSIWSGEPRESLFSNAAESSYGPLSPVLRPAGPGFARHRRRPGENAVLSPLAPISPFAPSLRSRPQHATGRGRGNNIDERLADAHANEHHLSLGSVGSPFALNFDGSPMQSPAHSPRLPPVTQRDGRQLQRAVPMDLGIFGVPSERERRRNSAAGRDERERD
ncbi:hypothetical protein JCM10449v2_004665 [Rhodotorula kratochvilovae]